MFSGVKYITICAAIAIIYLQNSSSSSDWNSVPPK